MTLDLDTLIARAKSAKERADDFAAEREAASRHGGDAFCAACASTTYRESCEEHEDYCHDAAHEIAEFVPDLADAVLELVAEVRRLRNTVRPDVTCGRCVATWLAADAVMSVTPEELARLRRIEAAARELTTWDWMARLDDTPHSEGVKADIARLAEALESKP